MIVTLVIPPIVMVHCVACQQAMTEGAQGWVAMATAQQTIVYLCPDCQDELADWRGTDVD